MFACEGEHWKQQTKQEKDAKERERVGSHGGNVKKRMTNRGRLNPLLRVVFWFWVGANELDYMA